MESISLLFVLIALFNTPLNIEAAFVRVNGQCPCCKNFQSQNDQNITVQRMVGQYVILQQTGNGTLNMTNTRVTTYLINNNTAADYITFTPMGQEGNEYRNIFYTSTSQASVFNTLYQNTIGVASFTRYITYIFFATDDDYALAYFCRNINRNQREEEIDIYGPPGSRQLPASILTRSQDALSRYNIDYTSLQNVIQN